MTGMVVTALDWYECLKETARCRGEAATLHEVCRASSGGPNFFDSPTVECLIKAKPCQHNSCVRMGAAPMANKNRVVMPPAQKGACSECGHDEHGNDECRVTTGGIFCACRGTQSVYFDGHIPADSAWVCSDCGVNGLTQGQWVRHEAVGCQTQPAPPAPARGELSEAMQRVTIFHGAWGVEVDCDCGANLNNYATTEDGSHSVEENLLSLVEVVLAHRHECALNR